METQREKPARIIETGRVQLGRGIEMLSLSPPYHHHRQCAKAIKRVKNNIWSYAESKGAEQKSTRCTKTHTPKKRRTGMAGCLCQYFSTNLK